MLAEGDVDQTIEHRVVGDVGRIETKLDQQLFDPEILRRVFDGAIKYCGQVHIGAAHLPHHNLPAPALTGRPRGGIASQIVGRGSNLPAAVENTT